MSRFKSYATWSTEMVNKNQAARVSPANWGIYMGIQGAKARIESAMIPHEECQQIAISYLDALLEEWEARPDDDSAAA